MSLSAIAVPNWGLTMTEGTVTGWLKRAGDTIAVGDEVCEIETTKLSNILEASSAGVLLRIVAGEGVVLPVGGLLGVLGEGGEADAAIDAFIADYQEKLAAEQSAAGDLAPTPQTVEIDGVTIRYLKLGEGEGLPVVMIHGFGGDHNNWIANQGALAIDRAVYALDLPGHGGSSKIDLSGGLPALAKIVLGFMDAVDIERAHLIAHSMGGAVALTIADTAPERVASLGLVAPMGLGTEIATSYIAGFVAAERRKDLQTALGGLVFDQKLITRDMVDELVKYKRIDGVKRSLETLSAAVFSKDGQQTVLRSALENFAGPRLVIWGTEDAIIPVAQSRDLPAGVQVEIAAEAGHMPQIEQSTAVNGWLGALIDR